MKNVSLLCHLLPLRCARTARLLALLDHSQTTPTTGYQPYAGEMDTQSVTGETLSWSTSTGPLTDDSVCGLTKQEPEGKPTGGNAVGVPAASCPIDMKAVPPISGKHTKERPLFSSSSDEEMEVRGKGVGRRAPLPARRPAPLPFDAPCRRRGASAHRAALRRRNRTRWTRRW